MLFLAKLITKKRIYQDIMIGTGKKTNLYNFCKRSLLENEISPQVAMNINAKENSFIQRYYPIIDTEFLLSEFGFSPKVLTPDHIVSI